MSTRKPNTGHGSSKRRPAVEELLAARARRRLAQHLESEEFAKRIEEFLPSAGGSLHLATALWFSQYAPEEWHEGKPGPQQDAARVALVLAAEERIRRHWRRSLPKVARRVPTARTRKPRRSDTERGGST